MTTYTGRVIFPSNYGIPAPLDLAVQLGRLPRWCGATQGWWSVLHHLRVCDVIATALFDGAASPLWPRETQPWADSTAEPAFRAALLLHEADEVCTGDIPTTWKCREQRLMVEGLQKRTLEAYAGHLMPRSMGGSFAAALDTDVKFVDRLVLWAEALEVGPPRALETSGLVTSRYTDRLASVARGAVRSVAKLYRSPCDSAEEGSALVVWYLRALEELTGFPPSGEKSLKPEENK